uniref:Uncharacterized protein n=1 Tax=Macaca fascicularis TaxID=9541 RepID=Q2PFX7_MACFA|nr:hypothetical protein [Macaca fascicularis]
MSCTHHSLTSGKATVRKTKMVLQTASQPRLTHPEAITCGNSEDILLLVVRSTKTFLLYSAKVNQLKTFVFLTLLVCGRVERTGGYFKFF